MKNGDGRGSEGAVEEFKGERRQAEGAIGRNIDNNTNNSNNNDNINNNNNNNTDDNIFNIGFS